LESRGVRDLNARTQALCFLHGLAVKSIAVSHMKYMSSLNHVRQARILKYLDAMSLAKDGLLLGRARNERIQFRRKVGILNRTQG